MPSKTVALIGTKRGLFTLTWSKRSGPGKLAGPFLGNEPVNIAIIDPRDGAWYAGINSWHWGPSIHKSTDKGKTWKPAKQQPRFNKEKNAEVAAIWQIIPDSPDRPKSLYVGVAPAALFHSDDSGKTWNEVEGLSKHETREKWQPGNGGLCLHTILINPNDSKHLIIGISSVGVFESKDRGASWTLANTGLHAVFHPQKQGENTIGSCIHKIAIAAGKTGDPLRLYQQNHVGMWRRDGAGAWTSIKNNIPSTFGFPVAAHPTNRECAWLIPLEGDFHREPKDGKLTVYRTENGGKKWEALRKGLPGNSHEGILRDGFSNDLHKTPGLYFGTTSGQVYASFNEGDSWTLGAELLPCVYSVKAFEV